MSFHSRIRFSGFVLGAVLLPVFSTHSVIAQVHYHKDGRPWRQKARNGPDAEVEGWFYNLGITGLRVQLVENQPEFLLVRHVLKQTPASGKVRIHHRPGPVHYAVRRFVFHPRPQARCRPR